MKQLLQLSNSRKTESAAVVAAAAVIETVE